MAPGHHDHPIDRSAVSDARSRAIAQADAEFLAGRLNLLCEPTRLRALHALHRVPELCVGDLALALDVTEDAAGYALRQLRTAGFVHVRRAGRLGFYRLSERFPRMLLEECLAELGRLSSDASRADAERGRGSQ
jgi:ArsR family transcriptional regulator, lead/cadmium/zinc/bismuth-responsive transcriptional repressor